MRSVARKWAIRRGEGREHTCSTMRSSCQTRALNPDESGQGSRPKRHPCRMVGGTRPCVPPCFKKVNLKPSLATTQAKVSRRVIVTIALQVQSRPSFAY
ncbi:hypothetical protein [Desulfosporosinus sp.]|uniref:hypothetical protein n=1 Tax=Desulfosporosinus sp. TaxID=157907 RepID=UPI0025BD07CC|nr:hypothetical protein [Desulfosporosinus sp.]MBC2721873.1 hypothetical protein [Desulfosporosinus sp.]